MSKLNQSIAVQRQIPEHIRNNYPAFVEFVKLYYEFLEESQAQNLESIRDIDTTLEEFIDRFKLELAKNVPINLASDKRTLLKHIRDFYLSRGSEESFKFIFKALFATEAEIQYPSQQMLRVSDGKWQQEISVFVRLTGSTPSLFPLNGKYINIVTPRKTIQTFASGVTAYNDTIFEVFIERNYSNEITIGSTVRFTDESGAVYTGEILPCPSKIKVYKPGKGFKVGQLFSLKTSLGDGCLVKITKTGPEGSIQAVQPIKFGLDYVSKFYSYLSSKSIQAYEYVHPLEVGAGQSSYEEYTAAPTGGSETFALEYLIEGGIPLVLVDVIRNNASVTGITYTATDGTSITLSGLEAGDTVKLYGVVSKGIAPAPNDPGYSERYNGFIDYGFASMQTYMDYDPTIPVQKENVNGTLQDTHASDRFFADTSYVGDIVQQFYMDASAGVFDDDLAIIEIDIGAVAKYPGYYLKSDGFISDEMYIQDGRYYQAFSYVIKVEEELRKYSDIIKALVHPSGMKMFAEYNIFNRILISAGVPSVFKLLQFSDSVDNIYDTSYNYNSYVYQQNPDGSFEYVPAPDAAKVFTRANKAAITPIKNFSDSVEENLFTRDITNSAGERFINIDNYNALYVKGVVKPFTDVIAEGYVLLNTQDSSGTPQVLIRNYSEQYPKGVSKPLSDSLVDGLVTSQSSDSSGIIHNFISNYSEIVSKGYIKPFFDSTVEGFSSTSTNDPTYTIVRNYSETQSKSFEKPLTETITERLISSTGVDSQGTTHSLIRNYDESIFKSASKQVIDSIPENFTSLSVSDSNDNLHLITNNYSEQIVKGLSKAPAEAVFAQFNRQLNYIQEIVKPLLDSSASLDSISKLVEKTVSDSTESISDSNVKSVQKFIVELNTLSELYSTEITLNKFENLTIPDNRDTIEVLKSLAEALSLIEAIGAQYFKNVPEEILLLSEQIYFAYDKIINDFAIATEIKSFDVSRQLDDSQSISDLVSISRAKIFEELLALIDLYTFSVSKAFEEIAVSIDSSQLQVDLAKYDLAVVDPYDPVGIVKTPESGTGEIYIYELIQRITDTLQLIRDIPLFDEVFGLDSRNSLETRKPIEDIITDVLDSQNKGFVMGSLSEVLPAPLDVSSPLLEKKHDESIMQQDDAIKGLDRVYDEPINTSMSGRIFMDSDLYDIPSQYITNDSYFLAVEGYQVSTALS